LKIAHLITGGEVAGGQAVALGFARAARRAGHDAVFLSPSTGAFTEAAAAEGFESVLVDVTRTIRISGAARLQRLLRKLDVDLLHTHVHVAAAVLGRAAARAAGRVVVSHLHIENHFRRSRLARAPLVALDNASARLCAQLIAVSDATRVAFERQGFPADLLETIHNGVDITAVESAPPANIRRALGLPDDVPALCHVGRLAAVKGQRELLEAVAALRARGSQLHAVFVGGDLESGGAYTAELDRRARDLGIADVVHFLGFRADAAAIVRELDVLVLPSLVEGLPLVVLEAMALGRPVVATAVGGTPEAVDDGRTGLLVPPRDVGALADAVATLIDDPDLRGRLGRAGRARVAERFDAERADRRVLEVYEAAVARR